MGFSESAELVWGIPVEPYDSDTGDPSQFWDEEDDDWRRDIYHDDDELTLVPYGNYEVVDGDLAILTSKRIKSISAGCCECQEVSQDALIVSDKALSKAQDRARALGLDVDFYGDATWWLVASYA